MATSAEYRLGEYAFPRGWFALANGSEIDRKPVTLRYFGQDIVAYRGASGRIVVLDAYCPHMGTHLGSGLQTAIGRSETHMEGDDIRCPFHAWRFGADGVCNHIPYHDGAIPPAARVRSWPAEERYGIVFAWHDPEGLSPDYPVPEFPEWDDPEFVRWQGLEYLCDLNHPIEILDNMSDVRHLDHLHGTRVFAYENEYVGHVLHQRQSSAIPGEAEGPASLLGDRLTTLAGYVGPGVAFGRFLELRAAEIICVTPIEDGTCRLWQSAMVKPLPGMSDEQGRQYRDAVSANFGNGLMQDADVWRVKKPALHVMQMPGDGPFRQTRTWYSQFYNPRAQADEIVGRVTGIHAAKGMPAFTPQAAQ